MQNTEEGIILYILIFILLGGTQEVRKLRAEFTADELFVKNQLLSSFSLLWGLGMTQSIENTSYINI
jgi:hypothetical protein